MTNQLREEDIEIHNQKMSNVFGISQLDIPIYRQMTNASDNSTHTTPLNYMRHSTPNAVGIRKVEQIKEVDQCSELDEEDNKELNKSFNTMKLTSSVQDDFFQLDGGKNNFEFQELEPVNAPINSAENYQISGANFYNENVNIDSLTEQYQNGNHYENYDLPYGPHTRSFDGHSSRLAEQTGFNGNFLVIPSSGPSSGGGCADMDYSSTPLNGSTPSNSYSAQPPLRSQLYGANSVTPREMWNPPLTTGRSTQQPQQQQNNMNLGGRRAGPATPAVLSSYATAMAQPQLANKFTQPPPSVPAGYADYHPSTGLRGGALQEDLSRYPTVDRAAYSSGASTIGRLGGAPLTRAQPHQGYYPGSSALQYPGSGLNASSPQNYAQQQHVGAPSNYYGSSSAGPLHPIEPDMIFQVQFKRVSRFYTNRTGHAISDRDFVVVEGDRGEDLGVVIAVLTMQEFVHRRINDPRAAMDNHTVDCILRLATIQERQQLPDKYSAEKAIVQSCNELAMHVFGLPIMAYDAEFQFDRNKLTIYYECNVRIDFRDFVRHLYSTYKARIWMKIGNINTPVDVQPLAAMALATGVHFSGGVGPERM